MVDAERCEPCEISVSGAVILSKYSGDDKTKLTKEFSSGKISINQLLKQTQASTDVISLVDSIGVPRDLTLKKATEIYNKRKEVL